MINVIDRGNMFGELGIIYNRPRAATCFALTDIEFGVMNKQDFNFCFGEFLKQEEKIKIQYINKHIITEG
jgi:CRP-like cAMP-binding protein